MVNNQRNCEHICEQCQHKFVAGSNVVDIVQCPICHMVKVISINNRKHPRKQCDIASSITLPSGKLISINIENISLHGYRFKLLKSKLNSLIKIGDNFSIEYTLPNTKLGVTIVDDIKIVHFSKDEQFYGACVVNPVDYSFNIRKKGFWLMDIPNMTI